MLFGATFFMLCLSFTLKGVVLLDLKLTTQADVSFSDCVVTKQGVTLQQKLRCSTNQFSSSLSCSERQSFFVDVNYDKAGWMVFDWDRDTETLTKWINPGDRCKAVVRQRPDPDALIENLLMLTAFDATTVVFVCILYLVLSWHDVSHDKEKRN